MPVGPDGFGVEHLVSVSVLHYELDVSFVQSGLQVEAAVLPVIRVLGVVDSALSLHSELESRCHVSVVIRRDVVVVDEVGGLRAGLKFVRVDVRGPESSDRLESQVLSFPLFRAPAKTTIFPGLENKSYDWDKNC